MDCQSEDFHDYSVQNEPVMHLSSGDRCSSVKFRVENKPNCVLRCEESPIRNSNCQNKTVNLSSDDNKMFKSRFTRLGNHTTSESLFECVVGNKKTNINDIHNCNMNSEPFLMKTEPGEYSSDTNSKTISNSSNESIESINNSELTTQDERMSSVGLDPNMISPASQDNYCQLHLSSTTCTKLKTCPMEKCLIENQVTCSVCKVGFPGTLQLEEHSQLHCMKKGNITQYPCPVCSKLFSGKVQMEFHLRVHMGEASYECPNCQKSYHSSYKLAKHVLKLCGKMFDCPVCGKQFTTRDGMRRHEKIHINARPYSCPICSKGFTRKVNRRDHMKLHIKESPFKCSSCPKTYYSQCELTTHMQYHCTLQTRVSDEPTSSSVTSGFHNEKDSLIEEEGYFQNVSAAKTSKSKECLETYSGIPKEEFERECEKCFKKFHSQRELSAHMCPNSEQAFQCLDCNKKFAMKRNLNKHRKIHLGLKPHSCSICSKTFAKSEGLKEHLMSHTGERPYECLSCPKNFTSRSKLTIHLKQHDGHKPYTCEWCGKKFGQVIKLKYHLALHTGEKPYECSKCGERFRTTSFFSRHKKRCSTKNFECLACDERFYIRSHFVRHLETHTGLLPFNCKLCNKAFKIHTKLKRHLHEHQKPHECQFCDKRFGIFSLLKVHLRVHTGEKPHECHQCGKGFALKKNPLQTLETSS